MMADAKWQGLKEAAAESRMRVSAFIVHRLSTTSADAEDARNDDTLARMDRPRACLQQIERLRLAADPGTWKAINERGEARLALERRLER